MDPTSNNTNVASISFEASGFNNNDYWIDNILIEYLPTGAENDPCENDGDECDADTCANTGAESSNPIDLRTREKRERVTDLTVNSPVQSLTFSRTYRQYKHDELQHMGLGWTHNHAVSLDTTPTDEIILKTGDGGSIHFKQDSVNTSLYYPAGSASLIRDNGISYSFEASNGNLWVFDSNGQLVSRSWPNGTLWTYHYISGRLVRVQDDFGRALQFTYKPGSAFDADKLWRVGDHHATGLDSDSPAGRYIEFGYVEQQSNGTPISTPLPLLETVRDVRGETWSYRYYGSASGESSSDPQKDYLAEVRSPLVLDTNSDTIPDAPIVIKALEYTFTGSEITQIVEKMGGSGSPLTFDKETTFTFGNLTTTEVTDGMQTIHHFLEATGGGKGVYVGAEDGNGFQPQNYVKEDIYRPFFQIDSNGNITEMDWGSDGHNLLEIKDANGQVTTFDYDSANRLLNTVDPQDRKTSHFYDSDNRQPTLTLTTPDQSVSRLNVDVESGDNWSSIGTPDKTWLAPKVYAGEHAWYVNADTSDEGIGSPNLAIGIGRTYVLSARLFVISGQVRAQLHNEVTALRTVDSQTTQNGTWQTVTTMPFTSVTDLKFAVEFIALGGSAEFYVDSVSVTELKDIAVNGDMETNSDWTAVDSPSTSAQSSTEVHGGSNSWYVSGDAGDGVESATFDLIADRTYTITAYVKRDSMNGTVKMGVSGTDAFDVRTADNSNWQQLVATYSPGFDQTGVTLQFLAEDNGTAFYVDDVTIDEVQEQFLNSTTYNGAMESAGGWSPVSAMTLDPERRPAPDTGDYLYHVSADNAEGIESPPLSLTTNTDYLVFARVYMVNAVPVQMALSGVGSVTSENVTGVWQTLRLRATASAGGSPSLEFTATADGAKFYVDTVHVIQLGTFTNIVDEMQWQDFRYDALERRVEDSVVHIDTAQLAQRTTQRYYSYGNGNGLLARTDQYDVTMPYSASTQYTEYSYDGAGRLVFTKQGSTFGSCEANQTVYDNAGNVISSQCIKNLDTADDLVKSPVMRTSYDALGRPTLMTTYADVTSGNVVLEKQSLNLFDRLGRVVRTIANYQPQGSSSPAEWVWREVSSVFAWRLSATDDTLVSHGADKTENIITDIDYDARGMIWRQRDVIGNVLLYGYDPAGQMVKTIQNAVSESYNSDGSDPDLSSYPTLSADADRDLVTEYLYDATGNLVKATSASGTAIQQTTLVGYDILNRPQKTIQNAATPSYDVVTDWQLENYAAGTDPDTDQLVEATYDNAGRILSTTDVNGLVTRIVYDGLGRQKRVIANYVAVGESPEDWVWNASTGQWETSLGGSLHGANNDQNIINEVTYDGAGRALSTRDVLGQRNWVVYDGYGQQVKVIRNTSYDPEASPAQTAPEDDTYQGDLTNPALDHITEIFYDDERRVVKTRQINEVATNGTSIVWLWTLYGYDEQGRQVKTITNASDPDYDTIGDPDLSGYSLDSALDTDIISEMVYDDQGRVIQQIDAAGIVTLFGYDRVGRRVKTVQNASQPSYDQSHDTGDPDLSGYTANTSTDEDVVTETIYDVLGRTQATIDAHGNVTFFGYDRLGRGIKTIRNATVPTYNADADYDLSGYTGSSPDSDQDRITSRAYDKAGRLVKSTDVQGNVSLSGYDASGRRVKSITNASNPTYDTSADPDLSAYTGNTPDVDQDRISTTTYDKGGRVLSTSNTNAGIVTWHVFDALGRRIRTINNYVVQGSSDPVDWLWNTATKRWEDGANTAIEHRSDTNSNNFDQNLISDTAYNIAGQVIATRDSRGTLTTFAHDEQRRRQTVTRAVGTLLETTDFTVFDKSGRVKRAIQNWFDNGISPIARDGSGTWLFNPSDHGNHNDRNLIQEYRHDGVGRQLEMLNPVGDSTTMSYFRDGQINTITDPTNVVTAFRYDGLRRRNRVIQSYVNISSQYTDPETWAWNDSSEYWEDDNATEVLHGTNNDQNIVVQVTHDKLGRVTSMLDPKGHVTSYDYDRMGRRTKLTKHTGDQDYEWLTAYEDVAGGKTRTVLTNPNGATHQVQREHDRLGRLLDISYLNDTANDTNDVSFVYDSIGNRIQMVENNGTADVRKTHFTYDTYRRVIDVGFDTNFNTNPGIDENVAYEYDASGLRTRMTFDHGSGPLEVIYVYDERGNLVGVTDWDNGESNFTYDKARRHIATKRPNQLVSEYKHDPAGRLRRLRHMAGAAVRAEFGYEVDSNGNRTQAYELLAQPTSTMTIYDKDHANVIYPKGTWADDGVLKRSDDFEAVAKVTFDGREALLTVGTGVNHTLFDVYIDGSLWQSFDGYSPSDGTRDIHISLTRGGTHVVQLRNRAQHSLSAQRDASFDADVFLIRFKQLQLMNVTYDEQTIVYDYDDVQRLLSADYYTGTDLMATSFRDYGFSYDPAGNRLTESLGLNGASPTVTTFAYNELNQLTGDGTYTYEYDNNGNLVAKKQGMTTVATTGWDRANRMIEHYDGTTLHKYAYDGLSNRVQQTVGSTATNYLLDIQRGLTQVLSATTNGNTQRFLHTSHGLHSWQNTAGVWFTPVTDGLGSLRGEVGPALEMGAIVDFAPYGTPFDEQSGSGFEASPFGYTGEYTDPTGQVHLRARNYDPMLGIFTARDPFEGMHDNPMSLNGYSYVHGNPVMHTDPSGEIVAAGLAMAFLSRHPIMASALIGGVIGGGFSLAYAIAAQKGLCGSCPKKWADGLGIFGAAKYVIKNAALSAAYSAAFTSMLTFAAINSIVVPKRLIDAISLINGVVQSFSKSRDICQIVLGAGEAIASWRAFRLYRTWAINKYGGSRRGGPSNGNNGDVISGYVEGNTIHVGTQPGSTPNNSLVTVAPNTPTLRPPNMPSFPLFPDIQIWGDGRTLPGGGTPIEGNTGGHSGIDFERVVEEIVMTRSDVNPDGRHYRTEAEIASAFGNEIAIPEALIQLNDGTYLAYEAKDRRHPNTQHTKTKFEETTNAANIEITKYALYLSTRYAGLEHLTDNGWIDSSDNQNHYINSDNYLSENSTVVMVNNRPIRVYVIRHPGNGELLNP